jgi:hypothetical protein
MRIPAWGLFVDEQTGDGTKMSLQDREPQQFESVRRATEAFLNWLARLVAEDLPRANPKGDRDVPKSATGSPNPSGPEGAPAPDASA